MPDVDFVNLLGVLVIAFLAPLVLGFLPRLQVPAVVLEIVLGVLVGPSALGWLEIDLSVQIVALLGLAMLLFLAGLEVDVRSLGGGLLPIAATGFVASLAIGWGAGLGLSAAGWVRDPLLLAVTVSATSLGLVVAVLKDSGQLNSPLGQRSPLHPSPTSRPCCCSRFSSPPMAKAPDHSCCSSCCLPASLRSWASRRPRRVATCSWAVCC